MRQQAPSSSGSSACVVTLEDAAARVPALVGGKGANLGRLRQAGFRVPSAFVITTEAYRQLLESRSLSKTLPARIAGLNHTDLEALEADTAAIRAAIESAPLPDALRAEVVAAYAALGPAARVAVRSSGTAEDLGGSSFAGLHDTYLDVLGEEAMLAAVRRCWASMWTRRAVSYRRQQGFAHAQAQIAVVVQRMVESEASGVMFSANPLTAATDEIVINASWGLGEAVVQGLVVPDQYTLSHRDLSLLEQQLGSKSRRIVRDAAGGVREEANDAPRQQGWCLQAPQLRALGALAVRVQEHYEQVPQDIEWALADGELYLLQSRPITGVDFAWAADLDGWQAQRVETPDTVWSRAMSDEGWTGAKSPLMYSWRGKSWAQSIAYSAQLLGLPELTRPRIWKYHRGEAYFNCSLERLLAERSYPAFLRLGEVPRLPRSWQPELQAPGIVEWAQLYSRIQAYAPGMGPLEWFNRIERDYIEHGVDAVPFVPADELRQLSDAELGAHLARVTEHERAFCDCTFVPFFVYARDVLSALPMLVVRWYGAEGAPLIAEIMTGTSQATITQKESHALWLLAERLRASRALRDAFETQPADGFLAGLDASAEGRAFAEAYRAFLSWSGHRGHAERDLIYPRRAERFALDAAALRALLSVEQPEDPLQREARVRERRQAAIDRVLSRVRETQGALKADILAFVIDYADRFLMLRDNERHFVDRTTFAARLAFLEMGARLTARGVFTQPEDVFFLGEDELAEVFASAETSALLPLKIAARRRDFERLHRKEVRAPSYLVRGRGLELDDADAGSGLIGQGTSAGVARGRARVVRELDDIGQLRAGEVLVCNSTDPGWAPVFSVISGIVLETGGMLAHASCLAREFGLPAVQLRDAMSRIADGSTIEVDGGTGVVSVLAEETGMPRAAD